MQFGRGAGPSRRALRVRVEEGAGLPGMKSTSTKRPGVYNYGYHIDNALPPPSQLKDPGVFQGHVSPPSVARCLSARDYWCMLAGQQLNPELPLDMFEKIATCEHVSKETNA